MIETLPLLSPDLVKLAGSDTSPRYLDVQPAPVRVYDAVSSTLSVAAELGQDLPEWGSVLAESQTQGRGQLGRTWISPRGNVYAALRLPAVPPFTSDAAAPAIGGMLAMILTELGIPVWVKWPNDLVLSMPRGTVLYRKVGGILLEERNGMLLMGLGLNISNAPEDALLRADHAVPAGCIPISAFSSRDMNSIGDIWIFILRALQQLMDDGLSRNWRSLAEARMLARGEQVELTDGPGETVMAHGRLVGLDASGGIRLRTPHGIVTYTTGSLRLAWQSPFENRPSSK